MEHKLNSLKSLYSHKKSFAFEKKLKKMLLHRRANLAHQIRINNNQRKLICVSRTIHDLSV